LRGSSIQTVVHALFVELSLGQRLLALSSTVSEFLPRLGKCKVNDAEPKSKAGAPECCRSNGTAAIRVTV
jgi:hypothetical protein